jgi:hypothetical protein
VIGNLCLTRSIASWTVVLAVIASILASGCSPPSKPEYGTWERPFQPSSIWYRRVPKDATLVDAGLPRAAHVLLDGVILRRLRAGDPTRELRHPGSWEHRCAGTKSHHTSLPLPDGWTVPDATRHDDGSAETPNNGAALLLPDGHTIAYMNGVARCDPRGPLYAYRTGRRRYDVGDLTGDGRLGSHGASRLSTLGGVIRRGDLSGDKPIAHALDLLVWANHLYYGGSPAAAFRWPAEGADAYASARTYRGTIPAMRMGALLTVRPSDTAERLGIRTRVGKKLLRAMRDYGGYVTDDAGWDAFMVSVDRDALGTFPWVAAEQEDLNRILDAAVVVDDNRPNR